MQSGPFKIDDKNEGVFIRREECFAYVVDIISILNSIKRKKPTSLHHVNKLCNLAELLSNYSGSETMKKQLVEDISDLRSIVKK